MKIKHILVAIYLFGVFGFSQVKYTEISSSRLNTKRKLKIKLPANYSEQSTLKYPLIIVFDGDYLFEPVAGQTDFQTYFDDMPGSIVVGIIQGKDRSYDGLCDEITGLPIESGLRFHQFIAEELIPYLDNNYNTSSFRVAVGHDLMGNFINSYLFKDTPLFQAYVSISPDLSGTVKDYLAERLSLSKTDIFYYMATSDKDISYIRDLVLQTNAQIQSVENKNLTYYYDDFENESHYTLVTNAIVKSFDKIFELYKPIREKELEEKVMVYEQTLDKYLVERYDKIEELFGIKKPITEQEYEKILKIAELREDLESIEKLGRLAQKRQPESLLGTYYLALHAEKNEAIKKANKLYQEALLLEETELYSYVFIENKLENTTNTILDAEAEIEAKKIKEKQEKSQRKEEKKLKKENN